MNDWTPGRIATAREARSFRTGRNEDYVWREFPDALDEIERLQAYEMLCRRLQGIKSDRHLREVLLQMVDVDPADLASEWTPDA